MLNMDIARGRLAEIDSEYRTLDTEAGEARLTDELQARWDALDAEAAEVRQAIEAEEARLAQAARVAESRARWGSLQVTAPRSDAFDLSGLRGLSGDQLVDRARSAFDPAFARRSATAEAAEVVRKLDVFADREDEQAGDLARYVLVHGSDAYRSAFRSWMKAAARGNAPVLSQAEADAVRASMSLTSANGGYALPTLLDPTLIKTGTMTKNPIRALSRVEQGMQDKWNGVTVSNVTTAWKSEGSAFTDGSPTTGTVQIDAAMLTAYVTGSYEIFADSNLLGQLPGLIGEAIDMAEGVAFITGTGSDAPYGVVGAISGTAGSLVTVTTRGSFTSASAADTLALFNAVPARYEDAATWVMHKTTYLTIAQQVIGTDGVKVIDMTNRNVILDSPVVRASSVDSATTSGNHLAILGDFGQYIIYDRLGVNVELIQNVVDGSGIPTGQRGLVAYKRVGAKPADVNAFRLLKA